MEKQDRIIARLMSENGISWNDLSERKKELARRVYKSASSKLEELKILSKRIDENRFTKLSVAKEMGVDKKTIGINNPEVSLLLNALIKEEQGYLHFSPSATLHHDEEIQALKKKLELLYARDSELVEMENKCREYESELKLRKKQYEQVKKEKQELEKQLELKNSSFNDTLLTYSEKNSKKPN